jgi:hypothetical protein
MQLISVLKFAHKLLYEQHKEVWNTEIQTNNETINSLYVAFIFSPDILHESVKKMYMHTCNLTYPNLI